MLIRCVLIILIFTTLTSTFAITSNSNQLSDPLAPLQKALEENISSRSRSIPKRSLPVMAKDNPEMKKMNTMPPGGDSGMMSMMASMMASMMGGMKPTTPSVSMSSNLPGFPGASHLYHVGATGFFLNHTQMIQLSSEQIASLNQIKEKELLHQSAVDRKVDQAEEDLWNLTALDQPDIKAIESKLKQIEALRTMKRLNFIRAIGKAAQVLTSKQTQILLGAGSP